MSKVCSIFSQILQLISRTGFEAAVRKHKAERHARGFSSWGQFVAMLFCQLGGAKSLREICGGLAATEGKLRHLGLPQAPPRSTLAYANEHRPWELYQDVFHQLLTQGQALAAQSSGGRRKFRFKHKLISMDATVIDLCASVFDWARFRRTKGAVKLHLLLDHDGFLPCYAVITEGKQHEVRVAGEFDHVHSVERALRVGALDRIISPAKLRPYLISAVERGTGGLKITEPEKVEGKSSVPQWVPLRSAQASRVKKK